MTASITAKGQREYALALVVTEHVGRQSSAIDRKAKRDAVHEQVF